MPQELTTHERLRQLKLEKKERDAEASAKASYHERTILKATMMSALVGPPGDLPLDDAIEAADEAAEAILKRLRL